MTGPDLCPHQDKPWRCITCCLKALRNDLPRLQRAVKNAEKNNQTGSNPGFGSRVPAGFSVSALALVQDLEQAGGLDRIEQQLNTLRDPELLRDLQRHVRQWRSRCALILRDALAPYTLTWSVRERDGWRDRPIPCPVVNEYGDCAAPLIVHRDNNPESASYGKPQTIRCRTNDDHEWPLAHGGWLRLGVLLGGVA
jgi:hypothetical protein